MVKGTFYWNQFKKLIQLRFHKAAGYTEEEFEALLPEPKKEGSLLVVSELCVNLHMQAQLLRIMSLIEGFDGLSLNDHYNIVPQRRGLLYWMSGVDDGRKMLKHSTEDAMADFEKTGRVACITAEVLAIYRDNPEIVDGKRDPKTGKLESGHNIDVAGSRIGRYMPGLGFADDRKRVELTASNPEASGMNRWGAASRDAE